ncbi:hypothetical protein NLM27_14975 [Bradyrhizobium sp. CCGB12]|uniref:hypothetical protein n=1 Tax=Bradyrhizobium sp. CCGB12 TaxID=2949632 RepID=UPI0020B33090|nr:hypothetical protein [Bradyrhizobium sp. CCGB12]MCP3390080.1 hypothetical protein [Bradyrhizobium sp. CCGB12]
MKAKVALLFVVVVAAFLAAIVAAQRSPVFQALRGNWDFVKSVQRETGTYYRLKVKLTYKGEPQDFDIVVTCGGRQINYADGGRTSELGVTPSVFGRRMSDGKALIVHPPVACRGETTANGGVAPDLLPAVVVFEDAETLAFGTAYMSDDAYDSPLSVLRFGGATIDRADRAAFEKFRREQPNLVKRSSYWTRAGASALRDRDLAAARIPMGVVCFSYARYRLFGQGKDRAHELWPAERPRFWLPATQQDSEAIHPFTYAKPVLTDHDEATPYPANQVMQHEFVSMLGMPRRGLDRPKKHTRFIAPSYYPDIGGWIALPWPPDAATRAETLLQNGPHVGASIDFRNGATRGFGYCRPTVSEFPTGFEYSDPYTNPSVPYVRLPQVNFIDGVEVSGRSNWGPIGPSLVVERDEFVYRPFIFGLASLWGDV